MTDSGADGAPMPPLRVGVLGPVRAVHEKGPVEVGPPQRQAVLAALLLAGGRPLTTDQLVDAVWGADRGDKADAAVRAHISVLRRVLEPDREPRAVSRVIRSVTSGYVVLREAVSLDVVRFRVLAAEADRHRRAGRPQHALQSLHSGLELWRGDRALVGVPGPAADVARTVLEDERLAGWEEYLDIELGLRGPERGVHSGLMRALASHPHRERLHGLLIRSYHRQGRRAEALAAYASARERLRADLGVEPGPALRELHRQVLADEPVDGPAAQPATGPAVDRAVPPPREEMAPLVGVEAEPALTAVDRAVAGALPRAAPLVGRDADVARVTAALEEARGGRDDATVAVRGLPGVGTSAVALAAAHAAARGFPGGVVALGREADDDAWASALATLDPAAPCLLLVDGVREAEDGARALAARETVLARGDGGVTLLLAGLHRLPRVRARRVEIAPLGEADSTALFGRQLGDDRADDEPAAAGIIVALHSGFPQILLSTAGVLASHPSWTLTDWVNDLMTGAGSWGSLQRYGLGLFFTSHYDALDVAAATTLRAAGLHPFAPLSAATVARMLDVPSDRATFLLEHLHDRGLVESPQPAEYLVPFLLWNYARIVGVADDDAAVRAGQADRMLTHHREQLETLVADLAAGPGPTAGRARPRLDALRGCLEALRHEYAEHPEGARISAALDRADALAAATGDPGAGEVPQP